MFIFAEIPKETTNLKQVKELSIQLNALNGPIPRHDNKCQQLPTIQGLYLSFNQFSGRIPSKLW